MTNLWSQESATGAVPAAVLGATFRPDDRPIYLVDRVGQGYWKQTRLLRYTLDDAAIAVVAEVPDHGWADRVFLSNGADGELLLVASSSTAQRYVGLVLDPAAFGSRKDPVNWSFEGKGIVALHASLTSRGLTVPVVDGGVVKDRFTPHSALVGGDHHHFGDCF